MSSGADRPRTYSDREVQLILKSAVELQMRSDSRAEFSGGMSLVELEQVAREAGLDVTTIRQAAAQLDSQLDQPATHGFLGSAEHVVVERTVDFAIDAEQFDRLLEVARAMSSEVGEVSTVGRQFGWKGGIDGSKTDVTVSVGDNTTTFRARFDLEQEVLGHFMLKGVLAGGMGAIGSAAAVATVTGMESLGIAAAAAVAGSAYMWARVSLRKSSIQYRAKAHRLVDSLIERAREIKRASMPDLPELPERDG